jgi:hypothetical protein
MDYEIENTLRNKADNWKIHDIESTIKRQKYDIRDVETKLSHSETTMNILRDSLIELINDISEYLIGGDKDALTNALQQLRNSL